jgi:hypothetical protein
VNGVFHIPTGAGVFVLQARLDLPGHPDTWLKAIVATGRTGEVAIIRFEDGWIVRMIVDGWNEDGSPIARLETRLIEQHASQS